MKKVLIAAGGTGGHIFPAISIARSIEKLLPGSEILFVGTKKGMENQLVTSQGYKIKYIHSDKIAGRGTVSKLAAVSKSIVGVWESLKIIKDFNPDVVVGMGSYTSGPVVLSAKLLSIPSAICEQNSVPGLTNKILSKIANRIFIAFEESLRFFDTQKTIVTGNPVREKFLHICQTKNEKNDYLTIFVTGGSQGAKRLNEITSHAITTLKEGLKIKVIHQTGNSDLEKIKTLYKQANIEAEVLAFIDDIHNSYAQADLVIARAGAGTISELTVLGKPAILIPFPYAANNHQYYNALHMEKAGAAIVIEEKELNHFVLSQILKKVLNKQKLEEMAEASKKLAKPHASYTIAKEIISLSERKH